jgi:hypothetical protein
MASLTMVSTCWVHRRQFQCILLLRTTRGPDTVHLSRETETQRNTNRQRHRDTHKERQRETETLRDTHGETPTDTERHTKRDTHLSMPQLLSVSASLCVSLTRTHTRVSYSSHQTRLIHTLSILSHPVISSHCRCHLISLCLHLISLPLSSHLTAAVISFHCWCLYLPSVLPSFCTAFPL